VTDAAIAAVARYLDALRARDWDAVSECLARDLERIGPYGDVFRDRDSYVAYLRDVLTGLSGYVLEVGRVVGSADTVFVELAETVDDGDTRLRTDEGLVFDLDGEGRIRRVAVYLRTSVREPRG
jgi:limonene-1,2-epoxide hydrolase